MPCLNMSETSGTSLSSVSGGGQAGGEAEEMMTAAALLWLESSMAAEGRKMDKRI